MSDVRHPTNPSTAFVIVFEAVSLSWQLPLATGGATEANASLEDMMHVMGKYRAAEGRSKMLTCHDVLLPFF